MIFDGHAYCFASINTMGGLSSPEITWGWSHIQLQLAMHHQPVWRARDRAPGDSRTLYDPDRWPRLDALKEVNFRPTAHGRFEWTVDGEVYVKQYLPPSVVDMYYPADRLVAEMDQAEVDWALLHTTKNLGTTNDFIAGCVQQFPHRIKGLAAVEEWLIKADPDAAVGRLERAFGPQGLTGLQFFPAKLSLYGQDGPWDSDEFRTFWDGVAGMKVPVFFTLNPRKRPALESYLEELKTLQRWMERYPDVTVVHTHGLNWRLFLDGDGLTLPQEVWAPFENPKLHLQLLFPINLGNLWDYPMPQVQPTIEECVQRIGADRLLWGTDMPLVLRYWSYRQNIDYIRRYCDFLGQREKDQILGDNMARMLKVQDG